MRATARQNRNWCSQLQSEIFSAVDNMADAAQLAEDALVKDEGKDVLSELKNIPRKEVEVEEFVMPKRHWTQVCSGDP